MREEKSQNTKMSSLRTKRQLFQKEGIRHTSSIVSIAPFDYLNTCMFCGGEIKKGDSVITVYDSVTGMDIGHWPCEQSGKGVMDIDVN